MHVLSKKIETVKQVMGGKISEADRNAAALLYTEWHRAALAGAGHAPQARDGRTARGNASGAAREKLLAGRIAK